MVLALSSERTWPQCHCGKSTQFSARHARQKYLSSWYCSKLLAQMSSVLLRGDAAAAAAVQGMIAASDSCACA